MENKKEPLKFEKNKEETLSLIDSGFFWQGTDNYGKPKYGYKISHISGADVMFVSDAVKNILEASNTDVSMNFVLVLDSITDAEGNPKTAWKLNGKTTYEWLAENPEKEIQPNATVAEQPKPIEPVSGEKSLEQRVSELESKVKSLEDKGLPF